ncbi:partial Phytochrome-like protein cph1, partial [Rhodocyclaceae bacterium]
STLVTDIADDLRKTEPGRTVEFVVAAECVADGDPLLLRVLLENLLGNAWKYSRDTALARIEFGFDAEAGAYFVRDNGAGFDMAYADKLFKPFQRLHNPSEFEGSGIGLASAARAVRRHGGRIWAESSPGEGAVFRFTLGAPEA